MITITASSLRCTNPLKVHCLRTTYRFASTKPNMAKHARSNSSEDNLKHPSTKIAKKIDAHPPIQQLDEALENNKSNHPVRNVLHWFRSKDIRQEDNRALSAASEKAKDGKGSLITMYLLSPKDMQWHGTSPARSDFLLESLKLLKKQLADKHIPLAIVTAEERANKTDKVMEFCEENDVSHMFANYEYEIDELRRDIKLAKHVQDAKDLSFELFHDQTVVEPGDLKTGAGGAMKVFTPYHKYWLSVLKQKPEYLDLVDPPAANDKKAASTFKKLFESKIPELPDSKKFESDEEKKRIRSLWPAGNEAGMKRLDDFLNKKVGLFMISSHGI